MCLTLEKAMKIVEEDETFYYKDFIIDNLIFRIFNYRLSSYSNWLDKNGKVDIDKLEMRGVCFNLETEERFWGLHKFFNENENPLTIDKELEKPWQENDKYEVMEKLDGSLILPTLVNNKIILRTKGSFESIQSEMANKFLKDNPNYEKFIENMFNINLYPIFELVGFENQIVVEYDKPFELRLIQIRDLISNDYYNYKLLQYYSDKYNIKLAKKFNYTLSDLRKLQETEKGIEGWVVRNLEQHLEYSFRKYKTMDYYTKHRLLSPNELSENKLIAHIVNEDIDDILSSIKGEKYNRIEKISKLISKDYNHKLNNTINLYKIKSNLNRKDFAINYNKEEYFGVIMKAQSLEQLERLFKESYIKKYNKLSKARELINRLNIL